MRQLAQEHMTMLIVTHEMAFAREVANHVIFMDNGEIVEEGNPEAVFNNPQHPRTQAFLNSMLYTKICLFNKFFVIKCCI